MYLTRTLKVLAVVILIGVAALPAIHIHAAGALIGQFYAGCGNFSVEVAVTGNHDDGGGMDRFWYQISDGTGKILYTEYATRPLNITTNSVVINLSYDAEGIANGQPTENPIKFQVIDLDSNNVLGAELAKATYDAPCLPVSNKADHSGAFVVPKVVVGTILATTPLYQGPNVGPLNLYALAGAQHQVVYRNSDGTWVAIWVGGNNLVWIPASAVNVNALQLALPPTRIDYSNLNPSTTPLTSPTTGTGGATGAITGRIQAAALRVHIAPDSASTVIDALPFGTTVSILGRNSARTYLKIGYNNSVGWAAAFYITLSAGTVSSLPVVQ